MNIWNLKWISHRNNAYTYNWPPQGSLHTSVHPKMCLDYNIFEKIRNTVVKKLTYLKKQKQRETIKAIKFILEKRILQYSCLKNSTDRGAWLGYSPWGCKQLDTTEQLSLQITGCLQYIFIFWYPFLPKMLRRKLCLFVCFFFEMLLAYIIILVSDVWHNDHPNKPGLYLSSLKSEIFLWWEPLRSSLSSLFFWYINARCSKCPAHVQFCQAQGCKRAEESWAHACGQWGKSLIDKVFSWSRGK